MHLKSFMLLTILPTVQYNVSISSLRKQIHPAHYGAGQIVQPVLIAYFVFYTHCLVYGLADIVFSKGGAFLNTTREAGSPQREPFEF
jgi:hypothetical protein